MVKILLRTAPLPPAVRALLATLAATVPRYGLDRTKYVCLFLILRPLESITGEFSTKCGYDVESLRVLTYAVAWLLDDPGAKVAGEPYWKSKLRRTCAAEKAAILAFVDAIPRGGAPEPAELTAEGLPMPSVLPLDLLTCWRTVSTFLSETTLSLLEATCTDDYLREEKQATAEALHRLRRLDVTSTSQLLRDLKEEILYLKDQLKDEHPAAEAGKF